MSGVILALLFLLTGCKKEPEFRIIEIRGVDAVYNISRSWIYFGSYAEPDSAVFVKAGNGDLLYAMNEDLDQAAFLVSGKHLGGNPELIFDTAYPAAIFLDGTLHSVNLSMDSLPPLLPVSDAGNGLSDVKSLYLELPLSPGLSEWLETSFQRHKNINLVVEGEDRDGQLANILKRFNPHWIYMPDLKLPGKRDEWIGGLKDTRLLAVSRANYTTYDLCSNLPSIVSLILSGDTGDPLTGLSLKELPKLRSLSIMDVMHVDMSWFENNGYLENLFLINIDSISSVNNQAGISGLKSLGLTESVWEGELPVISGLAWMSMPGDISQESFSHWCSQQQELQILEIAGSDKITDLEPLRNLSGLNTLMINTPEAPFEPLKELRQLDLLVIEHGRFKDNQEQVDELRAALPQTRVVPGGGFCLGSGWILLLIPVIFIILFSGNKKHTNQ